MTWQATIICVGAAVLDRVSLVDVIPSTPGKVQALDYSERCGGIAATAAVAIARLGHKAVLWGRVGEDAGGSFVLEALRLHGVDIDSVKRVADAKTPSAAVLVDAQGERLLAVFPGSGLGDDADWLPVEQLVHANALLVDTRWPEGATRALVAAKRCGVPSVLDADLGEPQLLGALARQADHSIFSAPGLRRFTGLDQPEAALRAAQEKTRGLVGVTMGADGVCWLERGILHRQPAFRVIARDTTGAGDTFHAAYAVALASKASVAHAMRYAAAAAAIKAQRGEGWDGMPDPEAVEQLLQSESI